MNIGVLGTGVVGRTLATRLVELGHVVALGTRDVANESAQAWLGLVGTARGARVATFADAAAHGALVINATSGGASIGALTAAGERNLAGKVLVDVANPLDFSHGMPPSLSIVNTDSLGEQIQRTFPTARVVKTLNLVNADVMAHPAKLPEETTMFVAGDDAEAKATAADLLRAFGWRTILDLGGIQAARGLEMYVPLWLAVANAVGTPVFNVHLVRG